jgi:hypothetical protein
MTYTFIHSKICVTDEILMTYFQCIGTFYEIAPSFPSCAVLRARFYCRSFCLIVFALIFTTSKLINVIRKLILRLRIWSKFLIFVF